MPEKIRAVFFDAGNTLVYLDYAYIAEELGRSDISATQEDVVAAELAARRAVDERMAVEKLRDDEVWLLYFRTMFGAVGLTDATAVDDTLGRIRARNDYMLLWSHVPAEVFDALAALRDEGYRIGVISNNDGSLARLLDQTGLAGRVDFALDSHVVGSEKPDPAIFRLALEKAGEPPEACIHVGDIVSADVEGARAAGIHPVLLDPSGEKECGCDSIRSIGEIVGIVRRLDSGARDRGLRRAD